MIAPIARTGDDVASYSEYASYDLSVLGYPVLRLFPNAVSQDLVLAEATGNTLGCEKILPVHQVEVQVRSGGVAGMAHIGQVVARLDRVPP
jgi:hypothetical protein